MSISTTQGTLHCCSCDRTCKSRSELTEHVRTRTGLEPFSCSHCSKGFASVMPQSCLVSHKEPQTGKTPYQCPQCNKNFSTLSLLRSHENIHNGSNQCAVENPRSNTQDGSGPSVRTRHVRSSPVKKSHKCPTCDKTFSTATHLKAHGTVHTGVKPYKCVHCDKCFRINANLTAHMRSHTGEKPFRCPLCDSCFKYSSHLTEHKRKHTGEKPYKCSQCDKTFRTSTLLYLHKRVHSDTKLKCTYCEKQYKFHADLCRHRKSTHPLTGTGTSENPFKCVYCEECFSSRSVCENHMFIVHTRVKCTYCEKHFSTKRNCQSHVKKFHTGGNVPRCTEAERNVSSVLALVEDQQVHTSPHKHKKHSRQRGQRKLHKCDTCDKILSSSQALRIHQRSHTGEKPFSCDTCGSLFAHKGSYERHQRFIHDGERPFDCDKCDMSFYTKYLLNRHQQKHLEKKHLRCSECGKGYGWEQYFKKHKCHKKDTVQVRGKSFSKAVDLQSEQNSSCEEQPTDVPPLACDNSIDIVAII